MKTILLISPYWKEEHRWMVSTVKLAELWQRLGYHVHVLCMGPVDEGLGLGNWELGKKARSEKVSETLMIHRVSDFFLTDPWNYGIAFGFSGVALRLAKRLKPDHIVVNKILFWSSFSLIRLRLAGYNVTLLSDALVGITWWPRGKVARFCSAIYAWTGGWFIMLMANRIVFFHPQPESLLQRMFVAHKVQVIPTGIDASLYGPKSHHRLTIRYVGRLESVKGVDDFVAAAMMIKKSHPDVHVQVVGWYKDGHPLVREYGDHISFAGKRDDIPSLLSETDIFVLPSYSEGLSNALMEAMSSGCACIASDVGGNAFLLQNGISGFLFPVADVHALAAHMRRLIDDPAKRTMMGGAARARIVEMFDWKVVGERYRKLFEASE